MAFSKKVTAGGQGSNFLNEDIEVIINKSSQIESV